MRKILSSIGSILVVICVFIFIVSFQNSKDLIVVVAGDTGGQYAAIGNSVVFGAEYAEKKLGSLPKGFTLKIQQLPDQADPIIAEKVALRAVSQPDVVAVIGHSNSGQTEAALKVYTPYKMPIFMPVATKSSLTSEQNTASNVYRLVPQDNLQASTLAKFILAKFLSVKPDTSKKIDNKSENFKNKNNPQTLHRVAIIDDGSIYAISMSKSLRESLSNEGIIPSIIDGGESNNQLNTDLTSNPNIVIKRWSKLVKSFDPNTVIFVGYSKEGGQLINQFRSDGLKQPIILTDGCFPKEIFDYIKQDPQEIYISFLAEDWNEKDSTTELINDSKNRSNLDTSFAPFAADSFHIIHDAVRNIISKGQDKVDKRILLNYLKENRNYDDPSYMAGPYKFGKFGDNERGRHYMYKIKQTYMPSKQKFSWEKL
jgi:branched-chain amino acid transport system substrate-binding protein